jgi:gliding motility-associated-like protein
MLNNSSTNAVSFTWNFGDGRTSNGTQAQIAYPAAGQYNITLNATDAYGCTKSLTKNKVITVTQPVADFEAFDTSSECPPLISIFRDKSTGDIKKWEWDFGDGHSSVVQNPACTYLRPGNFDVHLSVTDVNGCSDAVEKEQLVTIGGPNGSFTSAVSGNFCMGKLVPFSATTTNTVNHRWDFGDGTVEDTGTKTDPQHAYTSLGSHNTSLVLIDAKGCQVVAEGQVKIVINDTTAIDFAYSPECITVGKPFLLDAEADDSDVDWQWVIADQKVGITQQLSMTIDSAGQYEVTLHALNQYGCLSTVSHVVPVQGALTFIPNVFTPNGDNYNPYFIVKDLEKSNWDIYVYNRYGHPVFEKHDYQNNWDGDDLPAGVYYYTLINSVCRDLNYKGIVSIRR